MGLNEVTPARGALTVIRTDGTVSRLAEKPRIRRIQQLIGCKLCDTVLLDRTSRIIMLVDDTGVVDSKPVNPTATALMKERFGPQYPHSIHGDVVIANDEDFA